MNGHSFPQVSFDYDYRMRCTACGSSSDLTSSDYAAQVNEAHIDCRECGAQIHFGRAVVALRNPDDPSLVDANVLGAFWYHTTTSVTWPTRPSDDPTDDDWLPISAEAAQRARARRIDQALHLGTYETAIESMLRRMRDQGDSTTQFFLHRVRLAPAAMIERGYRDENLHAAANVTQSELGAVDVVRYVNAFESPGSISLAVKPGVIVGVDMAPIPPADNRPLPAAVIAANADARTRLLQLERLRSPELDVVEQLQRESAVRRGRLFERSPTREQWDVMGRLEESYEETFLPGTSPMVREAFGGALRAWRRERGREIADDDFARHYMQFARLLVDPGFVLQTMRPTPAAPPARGALRSTDIRRTDDRLG